MSKKFSKLLQTRSPAFELVSKEEYWSTAMKNAYCQEGLKFICNPKTYDLIGFRLLSPSGKDFEHFLLRGVIDV